MSRKLGVRLGRALVAGSSYVLASICMVAGTAADDPRTAALLLALSAGWASFLLGATWSTCLDIAGPNVGIVGACMNTAGQIGGILSPIVIGFVLKMWSNWTMPLYVTGGLFLLGAFCWLFIDPRVHVTPSVKPVARA